MLVVMSADKAKELGIKPLAKIVSYGCGGVDPSVMGLGPVPATKKVLAAAGLSISDILLTEANEAFALGHPIGASGARIAVTLLYEMAKRNVNYGLSALCIGGGMGAAVIFQRV